ncbi:hypothetical protein GOP47_0018925 [Adiantum capillus-veneris]|uniref:Uncharacterized protein n=1 Tax=Adiantum capillus-veneris TaxID=13818 RepID=A0A9D4UFI4_ADICA|nr:hypothetical protein GOP47_0018925 [Adiantum capillus-veneris]
MCCLISSSGRYVVAFFNPVSGFHKILPPPLYGDLLFSVRVIYTWRFLTPSQGFGKMHHFLYFRTYHVASGVWSMQPVQMFRDVTDEDECYQVHKYRGRLYFALEMWPERYGYRIWEVVKAGLEASEWVEAACTP